METMKECVAFAYDYENHLREQIAPMIEAGISPQVAVTELQLYHHDPIEFTLQGALWYASILNSCINSNGFVPMLTHSALVNHGGGIGKEQGVVFPHTSWWTTHLYASQFCTIPVEVNVQAPTFSTAGRWFKKGENLPYLNVVALLKDDDSQLNVFVVNHHPEQAIETDLVIEHFENAQSVFIDAFFHRSFKMKNNWQYPNVVSPYTIERKISNGKIKHRFPPNSLSRIRIYSKEVTQIINDFPVFKNQQEYEHRNRHLFLKEPKILKPNLKDQKLLELDFENGKAVPQDKSELKHPVTAHGALNYVNDSATGNFSLALNGETDYLEILPFENSVNLTIDVWFKADEIPIFGTDLLGKYPLPEEGPEPWAFAYRVWFKNFGELCPEIYVVNPNGYDREWTAIVLKKRIEPQKWYRFVLRCSEKLQLALAELYDEQGNLIDSGRIDMIGFPRFVSGPLTVGKANVPGIPLFKGKIDRITISNYAQNVPPQLKSIGLSDEIKHLYTSNEKVDVTAVITGCDRGNVTIHHSTGREFTEQKMDRIENNTYRFVFPTQPLYSTVYYYITMKAEDGTVSTFPEGSDQNLVRCLSYGIWQENDKILDLDFEEKVMDGSNYKNEIFVHGRADYSDDSISGIKSFKLDGESTFLEIRSPAIFFTLRDFTIDFWFKAEKLPDEQTDLLAKYPGPLDKGNDWVFGYRIWFKKGGILCPELYVVTPDSPDQMWTSIPFSQPIQPQKWYHLVMSCSSQCNFAQAELYEESGALINTGKVNINGYPRPVTGSLLIGHSQFKDLPYFKGVIDGLRILNYAEIKR